MIVEILLKYFLSFETGLFLGPGPGYSETLLIHRILIYLSLDHLSQKLITLIFMLSI